MNPWDDDFGEQPPIKKAAPFPEGHPAYLLDEVLSRSGCRRDLVSVPMTAYLRTGAGPPKEVASAVAEGSSGFAEISDESGYGSNRTANSFVKGRGWMQAAYEFGARARTDHPNCEWGLRTILGDHYFWPAADLCLVDGIAPGWKLLDTKTSLAALYDAVSGQIAEFTVYRSGHSFHAYANRLLPRALLEQWLNGLGDMPAVDQKWCKIQVDADQGLTLRWSDSPKPGCIVPVKLDML